MKVRLTIEFSKEERLFLATETGFGNEGRITRDDLETFIRVAVDDKVSELLEKREELS